MNKDSMSCAHVEWKPSGPAPSIEGIENWKCSVLVIIEGCEIWQNGKSSIRIFFGISLGFLHFLFQLLSCISLPLTAPIISRIKSDFRSQLGTAPDSRYDIPRDPLCSSIWSSDLTKHYVLHPWRMRLPRNHNSSIMRIDNAHDTSSPHSYFLPAVVPVSHFILPFLNPSRNWRSNTRRISGCRDTERWSLACVWIVFQLDFEHESMQKRRRDEGHLQTWLEDARHRLWSETLLAANDNTCLCVYLHR